MLISKKKKKMKEKKKKKEKKMVNQLVSSKLARSLCANKVDLLSVH